jgi:hypothetical protein
VPPVTLLPLAVVVPPVAVVVPPVVVVVPPIAVVVPTVTLLLPVAVVVPPVAIVVPRRHAARHLLCFLAVNWGIGPNQGTVASPMMYIWSEFPWICETGADGVNTTTSMTMMSSCRKYHGSARLWMEVPYPTVAQY